MYKKYDNEFLQFMQEKYSEQELENISSNGSRGGYEGLIFTSEVEGLFYKFGNGILQLLLEYEPDTPLVNISKSSNYQMFISDIVYRVADIAASQIINNIDKQKEEIQEKLQDLINEYDARHLVPLLQEFVEELAE